MIRILYGKAKSGKTHHIYNEIANAHQKKQKIILIVPEQFTLEAEKQLIMHMQSEGFIGIEIVSFKRITHKIIQEVGRPKGIAIDDVGKLMLLRRIFIKNQNQLVLYKQANTKMGFLTKFHDLIKELKQNRVTPELLQETTKGFEEYPILKNKLEDIRVIYQAYEALKSDQYQDEEDFFEFALEHIEQSDLLRDAEVWIDGFDSFTQQEFELMERMSFVCNNITLSLCSDGDMSSQVFRHTNYAFSKFVAIAERSKVALQTVLCERKPASVAINHIAENIQAYPYKKLEGKVDNIQIFAAENQMSEVEFCGAQILELLRTGQYQWKDIAVISNDIEGYKTNIKRIFDEMDLPYFIDDKVNVSSNPLIHTIKAYVKLFAEGVKPETLIAFVKPGFISNDNLLSADFELYLTAKGMNLSKLQNQIMDDEDQVLLIDQIRERIFNVIYPELRHQKVRVRTVVEKIYMMLCAFEIPEKIEQFISKFTSDRKINEAQQFTQIWNKTMDLFDQLIELMGDEVVIWDDLYEMLEAGFDAIEVGILPLEENQVLVGSLDRSRSHPIKVMFFLGFNDGIIPELANDQQLLLDAEKALFNEKGVKIVADSIIFADKEIFNIYFGLTRPMDRITFSYARANAEGNALRPSYLITKLLKITTNLKVIDERVMNVDVPYTISGKKATLKHLSMSLRRQLDGYPVDSIWSSVFLWYCSNENRYAQLIVEGLAHSNAVSQLSREMVERVYDLPIKSSVSKLEEFVQCPFKYFVDAGLKPIENRRFELGAPDIGVLFHSALEKFGKEIFARHLDWQTLLQPEVNELMTNIIDDMTNYEIYHSRFQYQYLIQKLKRVSRKAGWLLTQQLQSGLFEPTAFEVAFGNRAGAVPPIVVQLQNNETLLIQGVIDRVDKVTIDDEHYIKIIDYKSGRKALSLSDIYNGLQMQLMVYLKACLDNPQYFSAEQVLPAGAFYFRIDDPMIESTEQVAERIAEKIASELKMDGFSLESAKVLKSLDTELYEKNHSNVIQVKLKVDGDFTKDSKVMPLEAFEGMLEHVNETISTIGAELLDGKIDISPCKSDGFVSCQYCDFKAICQFDKRFEGNKYRNFKSYSHVEIIERFKG